MRYLLFFFGATRVHRDLQHHHNAVKAVKTTPTTCPPRRKLAGRFNQIKRARIAVEKALEAQAQALLQSEAIGHTANSKAKKRVISRLKRDFREQKSRLQEEIEASGHSDLRP